MPKKILIIDDDPDVILFLDTILSDNGYDTYQANNGKEGLEVLKETRPDLILLDLMMPVKSGLGFFRDIKRMDEFKDIPVIMVTGVAGETGIDLKHFFKSGVRQKEGKELRPEGYIEKPIDPDRLIEMIKEIIGQP
ncbi:MAG TPA: response regulator [Desulfobacteraceae bacterium]|nr:response regulator [Desulfobacteraceae bacterium]